MLEPPAAAPNAFRYLPLRLEPWANFNVAVAGASAALTIDADVELLSLSGSVGVNGCHLHLTVAGPDGAVMGGHVGEGCIVRTTAEILLVLLPDWHFSRELDVATGWAELVIRADSA